MSDTTVAAPVSTESAPAAAEPQVTTGTTDDQREEPRFNATKRDARSVMHDARATRAAAEGRAAGGPKIDANGRAHAPPNGQFLPADATSAVEPAPVAALPLPEPIATPPAAYVPQEIRVPVPEGHSLREQGREFIIAASPEQERDIRALLNSDTRRRDVEQANQRAQQAEAEMLRYRSWVEAQNAWQTTAIDSGTLAQYEALKEVDPGVAEAFLAGKRLEMQADAERRFGEAQEAQQEQYHTQEAQRFVAVAFDELGGRVPPEIRNLPQFTNLYSRAVDNYANDVLRAESMGQTVQPSVDALANYLQGALMSDPEVLRLLHSRMQGQNAQQMAEAQRRQNEEHQMIVQETERRIRAEAAAAEKASLEAMQRPANPLAQLPGVRADHMSINPAPTDDTSNLHGSQLRNHLRNRVRQMAAAYVPQR